MMANILKKHEPAQPKAPERQLPSPRTIDTGLTEVFMNRKTSYDFSDEPISDEDLACILWAADGQNSKRKNDDHRTTPTTLNWREIDIYVVKANGVWRWEPVTGSLVFVHDKDRRKDLCLLQPFAKNAPVHLVYVYNQAKTQGLMTELAMNVIKYVKRDDITAMSKEVMANAPLLDTGAKVMAVYMACSALGINCLARLTFDSAKVHKTLLLSQSQTPLCVQTIGYKPKGLLDFAF